jgi:hypothetical protein
LVFYDCCPRLGGEPMSDAIITRESSNDNHVDEALTLTFYTFELQAMVNALCEAVEVLGREATSAHAAPLAVEIEKARAALKAVISRAMDRL